MSNLFEPDAPQPTTTHGRFAQVAIEQGMETTDGYTYAVPDELADIKPGDRVIVPLGRGNRTVSGYVLSLSDETKLDPRKVKAIAARERESINLPDTLIELARWISDYYCCPLGMVFATMLPAAVKKGTGLTTKQLIDLADPIAAESLPSIVKHHKLPEKQAAALGKALELAALGKLPIDGKTLADLAGSRSVSPVRQLVEKGLLQYVEKQQIKAMWDDVPAEARREVELTDDQRTVLETINADRAAGFRVNLLHGVTGSGKTEVYIRAIEPVVEANKTAIVLVPEISLTPQTVGRFIGRFERVAVLHSGLTAAQRHEQWLLIRDGWAQVVVGARSAIFAPTENVGLIIVDEEHDNSYKQDQAPRYHGRDVAIKRAQMHNVPIVLGSATPSLESYWNAKGRQEEETRNQKPETRNAQPLWRLLELPCRVAGIKLPAVDIVDMMAERRQRTHAGSRGYHLLSMKLEKALRHTIDDGGQAMLLLNRRGYANYIACPDHNCGWIKSCDHCDVNMVYHRDDRIKAGGLVRCHYCSFENMLPRKCPQCGNNVTVFGLGTQRVEEEIQRKLPGVRMLRMDSDAMRTGKDYQRSLDQFRNHEVDLLVGTQMIAKGLDFPKVRLVGVISADTALHLPDFRATERAFQLVAQVAGRSGRSIDGGRVIVQTFTPDNPAINFAAQHDFLGYARYEMRNRMQADLPPITRMARVVMRDTDYEKLNVAADGTNAALLDVVGELEPRIGEVRILGPIVPPIARIGGYHRMQFEIIAPNATHLQLFITTARDRGILRSDAHMAVDVDPISLL